MVRNCPGVAQAHFKSQGRNLTELLNPLTDHFEWWEGATTTERRPRLINIGVDYADENKRKVRLVGFRTPGLDGDYVETREESMSVQLPNMTTLASTFWPASPEESPYFFFWCGPELHAAEKDRFSEVRLMTKLGECPRIAWSKGQSPEQVLEDLFSDRTCNRRIAWGTGSGFEEKVWAAGV